MEYLSGNPLHDRLSETTRSGPAVWQYATIANMDSEEFVRSVKAACSDTVAGSKISSLKNPPGRRPSERFPSDENPSGHQVFADEITDEEGGASEVEPERERGASGFCHGEGELLWFCHGFATVGAIFSRFGRPCGVGISGSGLKSKKLQLSGRSAAW